jgi:hypothetical protein
MIETKNVQLANTSRPHLLEGWVERVDLHNRRLHVRTGSRDRVGVTVHIPQECAIRHDGFELRLQSLLPCDAINVSYRQDDNGARIAQLIEMTAA